MQPNIIIDQEFQALIPPLYQPLTLRAAIDRMVAFVENRQGKPPFFRGTV